MHSRARLLLEKELFKLKKEPPVWGIETRPLNEDDLFTWEATIKGPKNTLWEGGIFKLYLQFDEGFNSVPPKVCFHTIPFHPNVDPVSGIPCIDFLDEYDAWRDHYSVNHILLSIQMMLSNPVLSDAVNPDAAKMCRSSPGTYRQMVLDSVLASKRVDAGLKPHFAEEQDLTKLEKTEVTSPEEGKKRMQRIAKVSFDDYHSLWSGIATTKPIPDSRNPINEVLRADSKLQAAHFGLQQHELQDEIRKQITEHNTLMYGKFEVNPAEDLEELKATRIQLLKQIYLPKQPDHHQPSRPAAPSSLSLSASMSASVTKDIEPSEHEVEELLAWSSNLKLHDTVSDI